MASNKQLLLINDDDALHKNFVDQFAIYDEYEITLVANSVDGIKAAKSPIYDLIILNLNSSVMENTEVCQLVRKQGVVTPIVILSANNGEAHEILGLNSGANDYVTKPFSFAFLLAKIRAQLRTFDLLETTKLQVGPYKFMPSFKKLLPPVTDCGRKPNDIHLTEKETKVLSYLYRAGGKSVRRDELLQEVWGYNNGVNTHTLETHVYRLRQKIEPIKGQSTLLMTEDGGYRLELG